MAKEKHVKVAWSDQDERKAETAKTTRLRALRLAKEAADKDAAQREAALKAKRPRRDQTLRSRAAP
jgi:hypothetical protein